MVKKHLLFSEQGRLGNQLFQYFGLEAARVAAETVHIFGFASLVATFEVEQGNIIFHSTVRKRVKRFLQRQSLSRHSLDIEKRGFRGSHVLVSSSVLFPTIVRQAFFQRPEVLEAGAASSIRFQNKVVVDAQQALRDVGIDGCFAFVHVRTTDYALWPSASAPAVLPNEWILASAAELRSEIGDIPLVVLGDDLDDLERVADELRAVHIHTSESVDMCVLSMASAGVLSASTFALWGANFARAFNGSRGPWIAPRYWGGVRLGRWYPEELQIGWLTYTSVDPFLSPILPEYDAEDPP